MAWRAVCHFSVLLSLAAWSSVDGPSRFDIAGAAPCGETVGALPAMEARDPVCRPQGESMICTFEGRFGIELVFTRPMIGEYRQLRESNVLGSNWCSVGWPREVPEPGATG